MRLIDADALTDYLAQSDATRRFLISDFVEAIKNAPTVPTDYPHYPHGYILQHVKTRDELLSADWDTLTDEEKERRQRATAIPETIVEACQEKYYILRSEVIKLESEMDVIDTFLCGYKKGVRDE